MGSELKTAQLDRKFIFIFIFMFTFTFGIGIGLGFGLGFGLSIIFFLRGVPGPAADSGSLPWGDGSFGSPVLPRYLYRFP